MLNAIQDSSFLADHVVSSLEAPSVAVFRTEYACVSLCGRDGGGVL